MVIQRQRLLDSPSTYRIHCRVYHAVISQNSHLDSDRRVRINDDSEWMDSCGCVIRVIFNVSYTPRDHSTT